MSEQSSGESVRKDDALFVGIDLGTSRASVSASNGIREVVPTYVGYPKDNISEELLGTQPDPDQYYRQVVLPDKLSRNIEYLERISFFYDLSLVLHTTSIILIPKWTARTH